MKKLLIGLLSLLVLPALAQDITNHSMPVGGGPGAVGWKEAGPCATGLTLTWTSSTVDPTCGTPIGSGIPLSTFGAVSDATQVVRTASINSGTGALSVTVSTFTSADVGKSIQIYGAGAASAPYVGTITGFTSGTAITVSPNAGTTLSSVSTTITYGTNNSTAIQNWINACSAANRVCFINAGNYAFASTITGSNDVHIEGEGRQNSVLFPLHMGDAFQINTDNAVTLHHFGITASVAQGTSGILFNIGGGTNQNYGSVIYDVYFSGGNTTLSCNVCAQFTIADSNLINAINNGIILGNTFAPTSGVYNISNTNIGLTQTASVRQTCIIIQSGGNFQLINSNVHFCNTGINIQPSVNVTIGNIFISNNIFEQSDNNGITFNKGSAAGIAAETIVITGNEFGGGTPNGIAAGQDANTSYIHDMIITNNNFYPNGGTGILLTNAANIGGIVVSNNNFASGGGTPTGINVTGAGVVGTSWNNSFRTGLTNNFLSSSNTFIMQQPFVSGGIGVFGAGDPGVGALGLGAAGKNSGVIKQNGATSGTVTVTPQAAAGTPTITWGTASGTPATSVPTPLSLSTATGAVTWSGLTTNGIVVADTTTSIVTNRCTMDSGNNFSCSSASSFNPFFTLTNSTADTGAAQYVFQKNRTGGNSNSGDLLGAFFWKGFANSAQQNAAQFTATQTAAASGNNIPSKAEIATSNTAGQANQVLRFDSAAHLSVSAQATAPTITAGCSGAGSVVGTGSTDTHGTITGSTAAATSCTITFGTAFANTPHCVTSGQTSPLTGAMTPSTTTLVVNFASTANYKFSYICMGN